MSIRFARVALAAAVAATLWPLGASATNGYFQHGVGMKNQGRGGAGIALAQDAMAPATNPAGMAFVGARFDAGFDWFRPSRGATLNGTFGGFSDGSFNGNDKSDFFLPEIGANWVLSPTMTAGIAVFGNGGLNTSYKTPIPIFGTSNAGVDLAQLFVAPTFTYKLTPDHAIGASVDLIYQRFKATGLQNFGIDDPGYDSATGFALRVGYLGRLTPALAVGATYQTKGSMGKFDKYKGLFAEQGGFDIPANWGVGVAFNATRDLLLSADYVRIEYEGVKAVSNPLASPGLLGDNNGPGFGWKNMDVFKFGVDYALSPGTTLRAGYNHGAQPIPEGETLFNVLAPGTVESHYTLGGTFTLANKSELSFAFMYAPEVEVKGKNSIPPGFGGGEANVRLKEMSFGVSYGWKF